MIKTVAKKIILIIILLIGSFFYSFEQVNAVTPTVTVPEGYYLKFAETGAQIYVKEFSKGYPDYVQIIQLDQGAVVEPLSGDIVDNRFGEGVYGGNDPRFTSKPLSVYWEDFAATHENAFCVINGGFFFMKEYPTRLPFPFKRDGNILSDGYGIKDFIGQKLMLELWDKYAKITDLSQDALYTSTALDIISGLTEDANKAADKYVGRTFVGIDDRDGDGKFETFMIFSTKSARQIDAADTLRSFGADKVMMLDGGESAQLICKGKTMIESERLLPQAIGIAAAPSFLFMTTKTATSVQLSETQDAEEIIGTKTPKVQKTKTATANQIIQQTDENQQLQMTSPTAAPVETGHVRMWDVLLIPITLVLLAPVVFIVIKRIRAER